MCCWLSVEGFINDVGVACSSANQSSPLPTLIGRSVNRFITYPADQPSGISPFPRTDLRIIFPKLRISIAPILRGGVFSPDFCLVRVEAAGTRSFLPKILIILDTHLILLHLYTKHVTIIYTIFFYFPSRTSCLCLQHIHQPQLHSHSVLSVEVPSDKRSGLHSKHIILDKYHCTS